MPRHSLQDVAAAALVNDSVQLKVRPGAVLADSRSEKARAPLVEGAVKLEAAKERLAYKARYSVDRGNALTVDENEDFKAATTLPRQYGSEFFTQEVTARLPMLGPAPVMLSLSQTQGSQWRVWGIVEQRQESAKLSWATNDLDLQLQWSAPRSGTDFFNPIDCTAVATLRLDPFWHSPSTSGLRLFARDCQVIAPWRGVDDTAVSFWGGGWQWGKAEKQRQISLTRMTTSEGDDATPTEASSGYEVNVSQRRKLGRWNSDMMVGVRQVDETGAPGSADGAYWTGRASLNRTIRSVGVSATYEHAADALWFIPEVAVPTNRFVVAFSLDPVLRRLTGSEQVTSTMDYRWTDTSGVDPGADGGTVYWTLARRW